MTDTRTTRADLYARAQQAHAAAKLADDHARQAALDRGAIVDLLIRDGASYREIGGMLGISGQSVFKLMRRYYDRSGVLPPALSPGRKASSTG